jgi:hypothetical protein
MLHVRASLTIILQNCAQVDSVLPDKKFCKVENKVRQSGQRRGRVVRPRKVPRFYNYLVP